MNSEALTIDRSQFTRWSGYDGERMRKAKPFAVTLPFRWNFFVKEIMGDFKKHISRKQIDHIKAGKESRKIWLLEEFRNACLHLKSGENYKVWQEGYHVEEVAWME